MANFSRRSLVLVVIAILALIAAVFGYLHFGGGGLQTSGEIENPIDAHVFKEASTGTCKLVIYANNPFNHPVTAKITQNLPSGVTIVTTDGAADTSSVIWSSVLDLNNPVAKASLNFTLPGSSNGNVPFPNATVVYTDMNGNKSGTFHAVMSPVPRGLCTSI